MSCTNPTYILTPECKLLRKCRMENKPYEYYIRQANARRNLMLDPVPLVESAHDYYNLPIQLRQFAVPCGKCELCQKRLANDYFIRNYYEWIDCVTSRNGTAYFVTLTYADEVLPHLPAYPSIACFDSEHIKTFLKRLRKYLQETFSTFGLKYFIVSEYGGEFGRPHYHGIFFVDDWKSTTRSDFQMLEAIARSWTKIVDRSARFNQLFDCQRVDAKAIENESAIMYCCKYIGKQIGAADFDALNVEHRYKRNHWQSVGLGARIYDYCNADFFESGLVSLGGFKYAIPRYYAIKAKREFYCYSDDGSIIYTPTDYKFMSDLTLFEHQLTEFKKLSICNAGFPRVPAALYDPDNLKLIHDRFVQYNGQGFISEDYSAMDSIHDDKFSELLSLWSNYNNEVRRYYLPKVRAQAEKYKKDQETRFLSKKFAVNKKNL